MSDERTRRIQQRAHAIWEEQGRPHGRHDDHWRQAEREIGDGSDEATAAGKDPVPPDTPMAQPGAQGTGGMGSDASSDAGAAVGGSAGAGASALRGGMGSNVANAGAAAPGGARALRGGPQQGAVDTGGSELGSQSDLK